MSKEDSGRTRSVADLFGYSAASVPERFVNYKKYHDQGGDKILTTISSTSTYSTFTSSNSSSIIAPDTAEPICGTDIALPG